MPTRHKAALPGVAAIGVTIGRGQVEGELPHLRKMFLQRNPIGFGVEHAQCREHKIKRAFIFGLREGEPIEQDDAQNLFDIAFGGEKSLRGFLDNFLRRLIGDEATREFGANKFCSGWMKREMLDDLLRLALTFGLNRET